MTTAAQLHRAMFQAIQDRDHTRLRQLFGPTSTHASSDGATVTGPDPVVAEVEGFTTAFPDLDIEIRHQHACGPDTSVIEYTFRGTHNGPLESLPPTGRSVAVVACSVLTAEGDTIAHEADYFDALAMLTQLGVMDAEATTTS